MDSAMACTSSLVFPTNNIQIAFLSRETVRKRAATSKISEAHAKMTIVEMCVHMDCSGCESKIRKALLKLKGVDNVDIDMVQQKVTVTGYVDQKKVLKAVRKTGRRAVLWPYPYNMENRTYAQEYYYHQHHPTPAHHLIFNSDPHSYNYYRHGYNDSDMHGYYQKPTYSHIVDERARSMFSDDNPNACSIM